MGSRLTYYASEERYVMSAAGTKAVEVTDVKTAPSGAVSCNRTVGRTLTFYKSTDTISVDGNDQNRTESKAIACAPPSSR